MMKKYNDIGDLYKEKFSAYTPEPPVDAWNNIQGKINGKKPLWKKIGLPVSGAIIIIAGITAYLLFANAETESSAALLTENNQGIIIHDNTNSNPVEVSTNQATEQTTASNSSNNTLPEQSNTTQNQNIAPVQFQEGSNATSDNSSFENPVKNETAEIKNNTVKQSVETGRVSENPPSKITQPIIQSKAYKSVIISKDTSICENTEAQLYVYNAKNIRWSTGETKNKITVDPSFSDKYNVSFTTDAGKDSMATIYVRVVECSEVYIPNAFTPNGDGMNDDFHVQSNMDLDYFEMTIYAAGGRQILFSTKNIKQGWDGTYRGQAQAHGVYFYNIRYKDNFGEMVEKRGELLLIVE